MRELRIPAKSFATHVPKKWLNKFVNKRGTIKTKEYSPEEKLWDELVLNHDPRAHFMQSSAWGESKALSQWPVSRFIAQSETALLPLQVFSRTVPGLGRLHYAPNVAGITPDFISPLTTQLREQYGRGLVFKFEPCQPHSEPLIAAFKAAGWVQGNSVQYRNTVIVDLNGTDEALFARIKKRARYEIRVAQRHNVRVEKVEVTQQRLDLLATLMDITATRSGAFFRKNTYTNKYWHSFARNSQGSLYFAWHDYDLLAGAFIVTYGKNAWYKDGGSVRQKSNFMGPRFLQWEIMRDLKAQGIEHYDLSGIPGNEELETSPMKGLHTFKTGFSNDTVRLMPAMELPFGKRYPVWPKTELQFLRLYSGFRKDFWY